MSWSSRQLCSWTYGMVNATGEQARLVKTVKVSASHGSGAGIRPSVASEGLTIPTDSGDRYRLGHRLVGCMCIKSLKGCASGSMYSQAIVSRNRMS